MRRRKKRLYLIAVLTCVGMCVGCGGKGKTETMPTPTVTMAIQETNTPIPTETATPTQIPEMDEHTLTGLNAFELTSRMIVGWNLGNTLDSTDANITFDTDPVKSATAWGNTEPTEELFAAVKASGFNTVRIPTTWYQHVQYDSSQNKYVINEEWLAYVKQTVDYAYELELFIILNVHHEEWVNASKFDEYCESTDARSSMDSSLKENHPTN